MTEPFETKGKIVLVTGGGTGVGLASAKVLAQKGFTVVVCGRRQDVLDKALEEIASPDAVAITCDVTDHQAVVALFADIERRFGRLDVLFNNAGINVKPASLEDISVDDWLSVVNVNLNGVFFCTREAVRLMKKQTPQGGRIINNGSISAHVPRYFSVPYTTTKHAITGLTKAVSLDGRAFDIACCQIDIGNASTSMTSRMSGGVLQADGTIRSEPTMNVTHAADMVCHMAMLPLDVNIMYATVMATKMPFAGRG